MVFFGGGSELKNEANSNIYWILEKRNWEGGGVMMSWRMKHLSTVPIGTWLRIECGRDLSGS